MIFRPFPYALKGDQENSKGKKVLKMYSITKKSNKKKLIFNYNKKVNKQIQLQFFIAEANQLASKSQWAITLRANELCSLDNYKDIISDGRSEEPGSCIFITRIIQTYFAKIFNLATDDQLHTFTHPLPPLMKSWLSAVKKSC